MFNTSAYLVTYNNFINIFKHTTYYFTSVYIIWITFFLGMGVAKLFDFEMTMLSALLIFLPFGCVLFVMYIILLICRIRDNKKYAQMNQLVVV